MKKFFATLFIACVALPILVVTTYYAHFYYSLHREAVTQLDKEIGPKLDDLEARVGRLENHRPRNATPRIVKGAISTPDKPSSSSWPKLNNSSTNTAELQVVEKNGSLWIVPELRITPGTPQEFTILVPPEIGKVSNAWLSFTEPLDGLAAFETLSLYKWTNSIHLNVQAKAGASFQMEFRAILFIDPPGQQ